MSKQGVSIANKNEFADYIHKEGMKDNGGGEKDAKRLLNTIKGRLEYYKRLIISENGIDNFEEFDKKVKKALNDDVIFKRIEEYKNSGEFINTDLNPKIFYLLHYWNLIRKFSDESDYKSICDKEIQYYLETTEEKNKHSIFFKHAFRIVIFSKFGKVLKERFLVNIYNIYI